MLRLKELRAETIETAREPMWPVDAAPKAPASGSSDALTDIVLDVEADLEDFE